MNHVNDSSAIRGDREKTMVGGLGCLSRLQTPHCRRERPASYTRGLENFEKR